MNQAVAVILGAVVGAIAPTIAILVQARYSRLQLRYQDGARREQLIHEKEMQEQKYQEERRTAVALKVLEPRLIAYCDLLRWIEEIVRPAIPLPTALRLHEDLDRAKQFAEKIRLDPEIYSRVLAYGSEPVVHIIFEILHIHAKEAVSMAMIDELEKTVEVFDEIRTCIRKIENHIEDERAWVDRSLGQAK
jgi:hypothetical protein